MMYNYSMGEKETIQKTPEKTPRRKIDSDDLSYKTVDKIVEVIDEHFKSKLI